MRVKGDSSLQRGPKGQHAWVQQPWGQPLSRPVGHLSLTLKAAARILARGRGPSPSELQCPWTRSSVLHCRALLRWSGAETPELSSFLLGQRNDSPTALGSEAQARRPSLSILG